MTHWERTAKPITRPLKVEELCKAFVLYREGKGLDKATLSEDRYISKRLQTHLGGHMAHELGGAEIRSFLDTAKTSDSLEHKQNPRGGCSPRSVGIAVRPQLCPSSRSGCPNIARYDLRRASNRLREIVEKPPKIAGLGDLSCWGWFGI